jgi:hypothetical protein
MPENPEWLPNEVADELAEAAIKRKTQATRESLTREEAVEIGRRLGADEAYHRLEVGNDREQRIRRAAAYAAWEYDGRPLSSQAQRLEFGVLDAEVTASLERAPLGQLLRKGKT